MVEACIEAQDVGFDIFYGASANTWKIYDTPAPGKSSTSTPRTTPNPSASH